MRILFFIDGLVAGGKERRLVELMKGLKKKPGIEFGIVVMNKDIHYRQVFEIGIKIHYLLRTTKKDISAFSKFYRICKEYKPDIVHCWDSMTAMYSIPACKLLKIKLVNGMIVDSPSRQHIFNKYWLRAKIAFPFSNMIIGNSKAGLDAYKVPVKKSFFIYNGFNFDRTSRIDEKDIVLEKLGIKTKFVIGMVAAFSVYKDYKTYFSAAQSLLGKRNDITFLALGSDTDSEEAKMHIDAKYLDHFRLLGKRSDVESLVNAMDICVLSTFTEGISNSILEYMALGKPVIATHGGGTDEIVVDGKTGLLVATSNAAELASKMELMLNDPEMRSSFGKAGKERIEKIFSINNMVNAYVSHYERLLSDNLVPNNNQ